MQSGKRLTLKDYFAKHILVHTRIIKIQMLNCYCQLSSSVIFRQICVSQSECKIDRPRPGLSRLSPRPHMKALGTRLVLSFTTLQILQSCIACIGVLEIDAFVFSVSLKSKIGWSLWSIFPWKT